jgi:phosphoribosyl-dephospho-CoA transferase
MERTLITGQLLGTHDLLRLRQPCALMTDAPLPSWVEQVLRDTPWVVVRRGLMRGSRIPIGVRGRTRSQRYAAFVDFADVIDLRFPEDLVVSAGALEQERREMVPALAALTRVAPVLVRHGEPWGPGGSVGFELATGVPTATPSSDLDVIVRQRRRLDSREARELLNALVEAVLLARVDVMLETPSGGVLLADLASSPKQVLVRTPDGPRLLCDPWLVNSDAALDGIP